MKEVDLVSFRVLIKENRELNKKLQKLLKIINSQKTEIQQLTDTLSGLAAHLNFSLGPIKPTNCEEEDDRETSYQSDLLRREITTERHTTPKNDESFKASS